jgi:hypothetical protein
MRPVETILGSGKWEKKKKDGESEINYDIFDML